MGLKEELSFPHEVSKVMGRPQFLPKKMRCSEVSPPEMSGRGSP